MPLAPRLVEALSDQRFIRAEADADLASSRRVRLGVWSKRRADYPASMLHHGVAVRVLAYIRADLEGNIVDVQPVQSAVLNRVGDEREMAKVSAAFEAQNVRALPGWKLQIDVRPA